jgi:hypothetical protein
MKRLVKFSSAAAFAALLLLSFPLLHAATQESPETAKAPGAAASAKPCDPCPCECDCDSGGRAKEHPCRHGHGGHGGPAMTEGMKKHLVEVRKNIAALRDHEKTMEGIIDPAEFRKAAVRHFRMLADLQESHLKHMESLAGGGKKKSCREKDCKERPEK